MLVCTPTWLVWPLLALHFILLAIEGAVLALLKRDTRIWRGIYAPALGHAARAPRDLRAQRPDAELFFITCADAVAQILQWKYVGELW